MISKKDVEHIAHLARIELTDDEKNQFESELASILKFIEKLGEVDTASTKPMTGGTILTNIARADDKPDESLEEKSTVLLDALPNKQDRYNKVRSIF